MANAEIVDIAAGSSHGESNADLNRWVIQVRERLDEPRGSGNGTSAFIFRLNKVRSYDEQYYVPRLVSIGPYHFEKPELAMDKGKDEAIRRMERRIQKRSPERNMKSIVESDIMAMEKTIRDFYADEIPYSSTVLAWMATRDACFIYELLLNFPRCAEGSERSEEEKRVSVKHSNLFDGSDTSPTMENILVDCFLFENQIPGFVLKKLVEIEMGSQAVAKEKLNKMMNVLTIKFWTSPFAWLVFDPNWSASHLLEAHYFHILGSSRFWSEEAYYVEQSQVFCLSYNYVPTCLKKYGGWMNDIFRRACMQCSHWMKGLGLGFLLQSSSGEEIDLRMRPTIPPAVELNKAGVRFHVLRDKDTDRGAGIMWIRFDPKTSTLYLPEMDIGPYDEYILRNFIALEASGDKYDCRPMTQFAKFMAQLIQNEADVDLLAQRGVINNFLGSNEQVAQLFNSLAKECEGRLGCKPIDDAKIGLIKYQRRKYKILWSQFMEAYFSKPWLVAGSIGAVLLLLATFVQVVCLFCKCN